MPIQDTPFCFFFRLHFCRCLFFFLPFRGMPSGFFFLAVTGVWQTPLLLRPFRRDLIPTSALPTSVLGVPCPWVSRAREFREREDYISYAEHERFEKCAKCELLRFCRGCPAVSLWLHSQLLRSRPAVLERGVTSFNYRNCRGESPVVRLKKRQKEDESA